MNFNSNRSLFRLFLSAGVLWAVLGAGVVRAQDPNYPPEQTAPQPGLPPGQQPAPQQQLLAPEQLDDLVAPIALFPDQLLSQVLVACTYPLEVVEAQQWLQGHSNLRGSELMEAARQQTWDPSVQALVAFPDVLG